MLVVEQWPAPGRGRFQLTVVGRLYVKEGYRGRCVDNPSNHCHRWVMVCQRCDGPLPDARRFVGACAACHTMALVPSHPPTPPAPLSLTCELFTSAVVFACLLPTDVVATPPIGDDWEDCMHSLRF